MKGADIMSKLDNTLKANGFEKITLDDKERQPCEIWTRVMGYHRPVSSFNRGKKSEFRERKNFREEKVQVHLVDAAQLFRLSHKNL